MRRFAPLALAALLLLPAAAEAAPKRKPCSVRGSDTMLRGAEARIYTTDDRSDPSLHRLWGCILRTGKRTRLASWFSSGESKGDQPTPQVWLKGVTVAVNKYGCAPVPGEFDCSGTVVSRSLATGRALRVGDSGGPIADLLLKQNGSMAFGAPGREHGRVVRIDASGSAVLEDAPGVDVLSLATNGSILYWTSGGAPRSAPFR